MKFFSSFCLITGLVGALVASPACERLALYDAHNLQKSFTLDLVSNVWETGILGAEATLYFDQDGSMMAVPAEGSRVETYNWSVEVHEGQGLLYLSKPTDLKVFALAPTCSGICVSEGGSCSMIIVSSEQRVSEERQNFVRAQIAGTWLYEPTRKEAKKGPAAFCLTLSNDRTFSLATGPDRAHSVLEGSWDIAPDGAYLIITTEHDRDGEMYPVSEYLAIQSVDFEDLVIDSRCLPQMLEKCLMKQPLYLSKTQT